MIITEILHRKDGLSCSMSALLALLCIPLRYSGLTIKEFFTFEIHSCLVLVK